MNLFPQRSLQLLSLDGSVIEKNGDFLSSIGERFEIFSFIQKSTISLPFFKIPNPDKITFLSKNSGKRKELNIGGNSKVNAWLYARKGNFLEALADSTERLQEIKDKIKEVRSNNN